MTPYKLIATLDAPGAGNWHGAVQNRTTGEWFLAEGKVNADGSEDATYSRFSKAQVYLDQMTVKGGGHQTSFSVSSTNVIWCAVSGELCTIKYRAGETVDKSVATVMPDPVAGATNQVSLSPTRTRAAIRRVQTDVESYRLYPKNDDGEFGAQLGKTITVDRNDDRAVQGFGANGDDLYILTGHSDVAAVPAGRTYVERYSWNTGKLLKKIDVTDWAVQPGEETLKFEAEGVDGARLGFKIGQGDVRELRIVEVDYSVA